jgi:hypothetical protein
MLKIRHHEVHPDGKETGCKVEFATSGSIRKISYSLIVLQAWPPGGLPTIPNYPTQALGGPLAFNSGSIRNKAGR